MVSRKNEDDACFDTETARRAEAVIKRMLNTPPQPRRASQSKEAKKRPAGKARPKPPS